MKVRIYACKDLSSVLMLEPIWHPEGRPDVRCCRLQLSTSQCGSALRRRLTVTYSALLDTGYWIVCLKTNVGCVRGDMQHALDVQTNFMAIYVRVEEGCATRAPSYATQSMTKHKLSQFWTSRVPNDLDLRRRRAAHVDEPHPTAATSIIAHRSLVRVHEAVVLGVHELLYIRVTCLSQCAQVRLSGITAPCISGLRHT